jgi:CDP-diacylglycerol--serine O-phosphatidyltransferase
MGALGKIIAVLYVLCSACRLARFNVLEQRGVSNENFLGLPTPAAAAVIIFFILNYELTGPEEIRLNFRTIPLLMKIMPGFFKAMPFIMVLLSLLMVSNVPYYSFKVMSLSRPQVIEAVCLALVLLGLIIAFPQNVFLLIFACYIVAGPLVSLAQSRHSQMPRAESAP